MKYLKLFENNNGFVELTEMEFRNIIIPNGIIYSNEEAEDISLPELQEIKNIAGDYDVDLTKSIKATKMCKVYVRKKGSLSGTGIIYSITKLKDEWFFLEVFVVGNLSDRKYYKCDQISGLIDCIKKIGLKLS